MEPEILASKWFTSTGCHIGVVAVEKLHGQWKAYIGCGKGKDQRADEQWVADWGNALTIQEASAFFPHLDIMNYYTYRENRPIRREI